MAKNEYWHLTGKGSVAGVQVIAELLPDGSVYVWPVQPALHSPITDPSKEQDLEDLMTDGEFIEHHGFFYSIADFMDNTKYSPALYNLQPLGEHESIRFCRSVL